MTALATITGGKIYLNTKYKSKVKNMKKHENNTEHSKTHLGTAYFKLAQIGSL